MQLGPTSWRQALDCRPSSMVPPLWGTVVMKLGLLTLLDEPEMPFDLSLSTGTFDSSTSGWWIERYERFFCRHHPLEMFFMQGRGVGFYQSGMHGFENWALGVQLRRPPWCKTSWWKERQELCLLPKSLGATAGPRVWEEVDTVDGTHLEEKLMPNGKQRFYNRTSNDFR